ncbi:MAG: S24/S26 family peptidase [Prevotella sp.]|nr:S24/S26 family peptidase [Prevotella sp.]
MTIKQMPNATFLPEVIRLTDAGHTVTLPLRGYSMRPFLEDGRDKAILVKPIDINVGDVVLAEISEGHFVLHRIISICDDTIILRGDGNIGVEHCCLKDVKAIATGFYRKNRSTADYTNERKWIVYSWLWTRLFPIRRYLLYIYRHLFIKQQ